MFNEFIGVVISPVHAGPATGVTDTAVSPFILYKCIPYFPALYSSVAYLDPSCAIHARLIGLLVTFELSVFTFLYVADVNSNAVDKSN